MRKCQCFKKKNIKKSHGKLQRQILAKLTRQIPTQKIQNKFPHREPPPRASLKMPTACWYGQPCNNKPKHKKRKTLKFLQQHPVQKWKNCVPTQHTRNHYQRPQFPYPPKKNNPANPTTIPKNTHKNNNPVFKQKNQGR